MWNEVHSTTIKKPLEIDTTSSKVFNYVRKDIQEVEVSNGEGNEGTHREWVYMEQKVRKDDWDLYSSIIAVQTQADNTDESVAALEDALCDLSKIVEESEV